MGDADYLYAFQQVVMPVAYDFDPDLVISEFSSYNEIGMTKMLPVAAGFDAAIGDQLGGCFVTPTCYAHMTHMLSPLAGGKLVVCLEVSQSLILKRFEYTHSRAREVTTSHRSQSLRWPSLEHCLASHQIVYAILDQPNRGLRLSIWCGPTNAGFGRAFDQSPRVTPKVRHYALTRHA